MVLVNLSDKLNKDRIVGMLGLSEEVANGTVSVLDISVKAGTLLAITPYLNEDSIRIAYEPNLKYWGGNVDVLVKQGRESEIISQLGIIVAALAKDQKFYQQLPPLRQKNTLWP